MYKDVWEKTSRHFCKNFTMNPAIVKKNRQPRSPWQQEVVGVIRIVENYTERNEKSYFKILFSGINLIIKCSGKCKKNVEQSTLRLK